MEFLGYYRSFSGSIEGSGMSGCGETGLFLGKAETSGWGEDG
jgi:hypothetical protein